MNPILPLPDALALPGPIWLFKTLLHLTFVLHLLLMNLLLGGALLGAVARLRGGREHRRLARWIEGKLPTIMAFTVTLGVAPLLFVQALYGHLFYTSSVVMAWPWLAVIAVLVAVYYMAYALSFRGGGFSAGWRLLAWLVFLGVLGIAHVYVHNMSLALRPEAWPAKYFSDPTGMNGNWQDPGLWPRFLHFVLAAVAVAGFAVAWMGARRVDHDGEDGRFLLRFGALWFLIPTAVQYVVGTWFLLSLPREVVMIYMGQDMAASAAFFLSLLLPLGALMTCALAVRHPRPGRLMNVAGAHLVATIIAMVLVRDFARDALLAPHFDLESLVVAPQWGVFALFAVVLAVGLATVAWMLRIWAQGSRA